MHILVLIPIKPNLHPLLKQRAHDLSARLPGANPDHTFEVVRDERGAGDDAVTGLESRVRHTAPIRQQLIDNHLKPTHDAVLWIDADLVAYPADLPTQLLRRNPHGVSAPVVLLDHHPDRFYDVAGFVERGRWARLTPPWFDQPGPVYDLDGVGCLYLVPASVYRAGARHEPTTGYTDHLAVCAHARRMGLAVRAYADLRAYHAYLPDFGEKFHEPDAKPDPVAELLQAGLRHQQAGRLLQAEQAYRQILSTHPNNADATHLLGLLAHQAGRHDVAITWIRRALELGGPHPTMLNNLGEAYRVSEHFGEASSCYRQALALAPGLPQLHNNLGLALQADGKLVEAQASFGEAVRLNPRYAKAHRNLGRVLQELGRMAEAMACFDRSRELCESAA
jgi:Flp pilus assembly protein TadD